MTSHAKILKASAGLMMLGSVCPWATLFGRASASGLAVHFGWVTLLAGGVALWLIYRPGRFAQRRRAIVIALAAIGVLVCVLVIVGASHSADGAALQASWGVYLTLIASVITGAAARSGLA